MGPPAARSIGGGYSLTMVETPRADPAPRALARSADLADQATAPGAVPPWTATGPAEAPAIVFIHGTRLARTYWTPQVRRLSSEFRCIALDLPAHGARAAEPFTFERATAAVAAAIDAEARDGRALLVGVSLGGYVAIDTAEQYPDRVAGLVLAGCSAEPVGPTAGLMRLLALILERTPDRLLRAANVAYFRARYRRALTDALVAGGFWSAGGAQALRVLIGRRYLERLGRLWTPVLIINGTLDAVYAPGTDLWAATCRRGQAAVIPWAGHLASLDRPRTFSGHLATFARTLRRDV
jgi:pimeloyl-ACP methyl ester carboxylesterase